MRVDPRRRAALLSMLRGLESCRSLPADSGARAMPVSRVRRVAAAAAIVLMFGLAWRTMRPHETAAGSLEPPAMLPPVSRGDAPVVFWEITVTHTGSDAVT